jgi:hypothetical protein
MLFKYLNNNRASLSGSYNADYNPEFCKLIF